MNSTANATPRKPREHHQSFGESRPRYIAAVRRNIGLNSYKTLTKKFARV
jgi:hypothetical protein